MAKPKRTHDKQRAASGNESSADQTASAKPQQQDGGRETIEAIVVALILAFLFRTFEAEAFVIPTGSMAPTLLGRHKDIECEQCGYHFTVGASEEVDNDGYLVSRVRTAHCPNCLYEMSADTVLDLPVYTGDRILVNKFPYEIGEPDRFEVIVFKFPEDPTINYIKRLIGLPGETIEIRQGDVYQHTEEGPRILRKEDPDKQRGLQILVYDNDHPARLLQEAGWPQRWAAVKIQDAFSSIAGWSEDDAGWTADTDDRSFAIEASKTADGGHRWVRYRHFPAGPSDWQDVLNDLSVESPRPMLITDYCGYNAYTRTGNIGDVEFGKYWVGDLTVTCQVDVTEVTPNAELVLELVEGARKYRCKIDVNTGQATLFHPRDGHRDEDEEDAQEVLATGQTVLQGAGQYNISFANVDDRLCLWIDDGDWLDSNETVFAAEYKPYGGLPRQPPSDDDLTPVGIAARGLAARVSHLLLERDVYYRSEIRHPNDEFLDDERHQQRTIREYDLETDNYNNDLARLLSEPAAWFEEYQEYLSASMTDQTDGKYKDFEFTFTMGPDEFFVMGDNSPRSKDSRLWSNSRHAARRHSVPKSALVGKAFFIYWPHGIPFMNDGRGFPADGNSSLKDIPAINRFLFHQTAPGHVDPDGYPSRRLPFYPNFSRMKRIR